MGRLQNIALVFPASNEAEREWCCYLGKLLNEIPAFNKDKVLPAAFAENVYPGTEFKTGNAPLPMIILDTDEEISLTAGNLSVCDRNSAKIKLSDMLFERDVSINEAGSDAIPISNLYQQLNGRLSGIDHTGVNVPVSKVDKSSWTEFMLKLSTVTNLYNYPGEEWPFIIPADEAEYLTDITNFTIKRTPKFEIVYDVYTDKPILQFALETDMSRDEMERAFPVPIGFAIPGLDEIFRSVFIASPWDDEVAFRFDLYYTSNTAKLNDWETGSG